MAAEESIDENFVLELMKMSTTDLKVKLEELKARNEVLDQQVKQRDEKFLKLVNENVTLDAELVEKFEKLEAMKAKFGKVAFETFDIQKKYNKVIDPYNAMHQSLVEHKAKFSKISKQLNEYQKDQDAYADQLKREGEKSRFSEWLPSL